MNAIHSLGYHGQTVIYIYDVAIDIRLMILLFIKVTLTTSPEADLSL